MLINKKLKEESITEKMYEATKNCLNLLMDKLVFLDPYTSGGTCPCISKKFSKIGNLSRILGEIFVHSFCECYSSLLSLSISSLPQFLRYQSVGTATGPTALCGIRTTPRIEILSLEIQPSDPLGE